MKKKLVAALLCAAMAAGTLAGCGSSSGGAASSAAGTSGTPETSSAAGTSGAAEASSAAGTSGAAEASSGAEEASSAAEASSGAAEADAEDPSGLVAPTQKGDWVIGFSNYFLGNSWKQQMEAEFKYAADGLKEAGVISDYVMLNADNDQSKQIADINDLITMGVDAICVTCITTDALNDVLEEAEEEGIRVITFDNVSNSDKLTSAVSCPDYDCGYLCGEWMGKQVEDGAKLVILDGTAGSSTNENRHQGMIDGMDASGKSYEVLTVANCGWDYATAKTAMEDIVAAYPEIDGILSQGGAMSQAAIEVLEANGRDLVPTTGEASNGFMRLWKDKGFDSVAFVAPNYMSAQALYTIVDVLNGGTCEKEISCTHDPVTIDNLDEAFKENLSDSYWAFSRLPDSELEALFKE